MPSTAPAEKLTSGLHVRMFDFDPGSSAAALLITTNATAWQDMRDTCNLLVGVMTTIAAADGMQLLEIVASTETSFTTSLTVIKAHAATVADAVGDQVYLEISESDLQAVGVDDLRYVTARCTFDDATDEAVVAFVAKPNRSYTDRTATTIA